MTLGPTDGLGLGGGVSRFDDYHGRTEGGLYHGALRYPSPFFDIGHTYLPTSVSQMLRWCRYYFLVNPLINAVTYKMAEYPITPIIFDEEDIKIRERWEDIADNQLKIRTFQIEVGLDYFAYGNAFVTIHFPFKKYLCCPVCKNEVEIQKAAYKFRNLKYYFACDKCQTTSEAQVKDINIKDLKGIRLVRWNPEYIKIEHNEVTGESDYFFEIPTPVKNDITMGKKHIVEKIPDVFIEALRKQRTLCFTADNMFHLKRPTIAQKDMGWGMPLILPVLKDTYYLQILRKAQEAIAQQHIVPLRILFPQAGSASADPYSTTDLGMWRKRIEAEIQKWRSDPNYIPILPLPIGNETIGGEGKALMLHQEMRAWSEQIVAGMHVPIEFVFGGMQYCNSADTLVHTSHGLEELEEFTPSSEGRAPSDRQIVNQQGIQDVSIVHNVGLKKAARLQTRLGLELVAAYTHPVYVLQPDLLTTYKTLEELRPGDRVAVKAGANLWPTDIPKISFQTRYTGTRFEEVRLPFELTPELARLLGYLISEGSCTEESRIGFGNTDQEVNQDFADCCEVVFGYRPKFHHNKSQKTGRPFYQTEISRRQAIEFLYSLGIGGYAKEKIIPRIIRQAPKNLVAEFLKAYFEGDGGPDDVEEKQMVSASSTSGRLLQETQLLLLNMGIVSSRYAPGTQSTYVLQIRSEYVDTYAVEVGFVSSYKKEVLGRRTSTRLSSCLSSQIPFLKECLDEFRDRHFKNCSAWKFEPLEVDLTQEEYTVDEVATLIDRERSTIHIHIKSGALIATKQKTSQGHFPGYRISRADLDSFLRNHGLGRRRTTPKSFWGISYEKLATRDLSFIRETEPELARRIESLAEERLIWDEVIETELLDTEIPMRDLTVAGVSAYQGNGIISHNSGSNVSMRMLENQFLGFRVNQLIMVRDFICGRVADYMGWVRPRMHQKRFKMADDLQRSALIFQLNQAMKISDTTLLDDLDYDVVQEEKFKEAELGKQIGNQRKMQLAQAALQGDIQVLTAKYQVQSQKLLQEAGMDAAQAQQGMAGAQQQTQQIQQFAQQQGGQPAGGAGIGQQNQQPDQGAQAAPGMPAGATAYPENGQQMPGEGIPGEMQSPLNAGMQQSGYNLMYLARRAATELEKMDDMSRYTELMKMKGMNPRLYTLVLQLLSSREGSQRDNLNPLQSPLPEQKPPRRQNTLL